MAPLARTPHVRNRRRWHRTQSMAQLVNRAGLHIAQLLRAAAPTQQQASAQPDAAIVDRPSRLFAAAVPAMTLEGSHVGLHQPVDSEKPCLELRSVHARSIFEPAILALS